MARSSTSFVPGSRTGKGRPKGSPNKVSSEVRAIAKALVEDRAYREGLQERLRDGTAAPAVEVMLWNYAYGKPKNELALTLDIMSQQQLANLRQLGVSTGEQEALLLEAGNDVVDGVVVRGTAGQSNTK
jgi:hypothetical protein